MTSANLTTSHTPYNERRLADCKRVRNIEEPAPNILLTRLLGEAIKGKNFSGHTFGNLSFEFWKRYQPTINRKKREGISEVNVTISYKDGIIFIEAKHLAPVNLKTTHDSRRDQMIPHLDLAAYPSRRTK